MSRSPASLPCLPLEPFDGPLDLLLAEVRRQNVSIVKIAMAPIAARFLEYVRAAARHNVNLNIEWLHMAATLIHWKSRSLLSDTSGEPRADSIRDDLVQQLLAHRKQAAEDLKQRRSAEGNRFSRAAERGLDEEAAAVGGEEPRFPSVWDLMQEAREIASWLRERGAERPPGPDAFMVEPEEVTVGEMIEYLRAQFSAAAGLRLDGRRLLADQPTVERRSCLFLGMLEMANEGQLEIGQSEGFGPIWLGLPFPSGRGLV